MGVPCIESAVRISHPRNTPNISACREMSLASYQLFRTSVVVEARRVDVCRRNEVTSTENQAKSKPFSYLSQMYGYTETSQK